MKKLFYSLIAVMLFSVSLSAQVYTHGSRVKIATVNELTPLPGVFKIMVLDPADNEIKFVNSTSLPGGNLTASNGLTRLANDIKLGGQLTDASTLIDLNSNVLSFNSSSDNNRLVMNATNGNIDIESKTGIFQLFGNTTDRIRILPQGSTALPTANQYLKTIDGLGSAEWSDLPPGIGNLYTIDGDISGSRTITLQPTGVIIFNPSAGFAAHTISPGLFSALNYPNLNLSDDGGASIDLSGGNVDIGTLSGDIKIDLPVAPSINQVLAAKDVNGNLKWLTLPAGGSTEGVNASGTIAGNDLVLQLGDNTAATDSRITINQAAESILFNFGGSIGFTGNDVNFNGNTLINVGAGADPNDAVNVSQLNLKQDIITASNGLTKTAVDVELGGSLSAFTTIATGAQRFFIGESVSGEGGLELVKGIFVSENVNDIELKNDDGSTLFLNDTDVVLSNTAGGRVQLSTNGTAVFGTSAVGFAAQFQTGNDEYQFRKTGSANYIAFDVSAITTNKTATWRDQTITVAGLSDIASIASANNATIALSKVTGERFTTSANAATNYVVTIDNTTVGAFSKTLINAATEPTVNGVATGKVAGAPFVASTDMFMIIYTDNGTTIEYYFLAK